MHTTRELGLKITAAQREYYRYTGISAEAERRGAGCSRPELSWALRIKTPKETAGAPSVATPAPAKE